MSPKLLTKTPSVGHSGVANALQVAATGPRAGTISVLAPSLFFNYTLGALNGLHQANLCAAPRPAPKRPDPEDHRRCHLLSVIVFANCKLRQRTAANQIDKTPSGPTHRIVLCGAIAINSITDKVTTKRWLCYACRAML